MCVVRVTPNPTQPIRCAPARSHHNCRFPLFLLLRVFSAGEPSATIGCNDPNEASCKVSLWGVSTSCPSLNVPCGSYLVVSDGDNYCYGYSPDCNRRQRKRHRQLRGAATDGITSGTFGSSTSTSNREMVEGLPFRIGGPKRGRRANQYL
jgi:hypothetical protein